MGKNVKSSTVGSKSQKSTAKSGISFVAQTKGKGDNVLIDGNYIFSAHRNEAGNYVIHKGGVEFSPDKVIEAVEAVRATPALAANSTPKADSPTIKADAFLKLTKAQQAVMLSQGVSIV